MYAVFKTGGKQYKVTNGDVLLVEKLSANEGDKVRFTQVLAMGDKKQEIGTPIISGACVEAEILSQTKGKKTINFVKRRRKHSSQRKKGHRQNLTVLKVLEIKSDEKLSVKNDTNFEVIGKAKIATKSTVKTVKDTSKDTSSVKDSKIESPVKKSATKTPTKQASVKKSASTDESKPKAEKKSAKTPVNKKKTAEEPPKTAPKQKSSTKPKEKPKS